MKRTNNQEKGLVTLVSVVIIIIIISIITLSLAALTRRNLRQAVDEQLSSQALYAAESGVNAAVKKIDSGAINENITSCSETASKIGSQDLADTTTANVKYTCVLVDFTGQDITTEMKNETMKVYPLIDANSSNFVDGLEITWSNQDVPTPSFIDCTTNSCLSPFGAWNTNRIGLLRVRLVPYPASGTTRSIIDSNTIDITAYPFKMPDINVASTVDPLTFSPTSPKSHVVAGTCDAVNKTCKITVTGLYNPANTDAFPGRYYILLYSYYATRTNVVIKGTSKNSSGALVPTSFSGAQATIDSTGVAGDSAKRLRVKINLDKTSDLSIGTLNVGNSLCKRFTTSQIGTSPDTSGYPSGFACDPF